GFVNGETAKFTVTGSQTTVGQSENTYNIDWKAKDTTAKKGNYTISEDLGDLVVISKSIVPDDKNTPEEKKTGIKVTAPKDTTYSGNEQKREPVIEDTKTGKTLDKDDYSLSYSDDVTNAVTVTITVTGKGNYTGKFEVTYKINPRKVTLKSETASKPYDGTALTKPAVTVSGDGFVKGEVSDIKATGLVTTVSEGKVTNTITFTKENNYKDGNYAIDKEEGKLSITAQSIDPGTDPEKPNPDYTGAKVNSPSDKVYDGNEHKWIPTVTDKADKKLEAGTDYTVEYSTKNFKDVGTIDVTITGIGNYSGTVTRTYKITPKSVTVTADNKSKVFGETDPKFTAKVVGTLGNDTVEYTLSRETGEAVGKYEITVKGDKLQGNYTVTYVAGTLKITSQSIDPGTDPEKPNPDYTGAKVNSPSDEVYDGKEHKWIPTVTDKADKKLEAGKDYTVEYSTKNFKDVGTVEVTITGIGNYSGTVKRSYKVTPKEYTVTTDSATKTYSGTALTAGGKVEGIVSGETVEFTTTGSQTEVGTSKNTYELVWKSAKATNYKLAKESIGELTVKAKSIVPDDSDKTGITVSEPSDSKYDGKEHKEVLTVTDTKTGKELVAGTDYSVTYSSDLVNAGTVKVTVAGLGNYSGSFTKTYRITKRSVTLTSATVSKVYDGSALTNTSITVSGDGFVEGEGASYEVTGSQTVVGNSANSFEYKLNENTLASNYNITKVVGTLTITAAPAPVTPATPSTPSSTTSTTPRTPSAPQVTTPVETVEKETTPKAEPKKEEKVEEEYTPKASPQYYWALINLICAILTVLFGLLLLISKRHKDEDDDEEEDETKQQTNNDDEENEQEKKRGLFTRVLAVLIAIVSVVFFLVTEALSLRWTWTDQWTIWMVVIGLVQIVVFFVGRKWKNVDNDDDDEEAQQA
uniref:MBG domain-containing protein n=1 Tax=Holdemanella porci TaxID=2652276 RepID=UPI003AF0A1AF